MSIRIKMPNGFYVDISKMLKDNDITFEQFIDHYKKTNYIMFHITNEMNCLEYYTNLQTLSDIKKAYNNG